MQNPDFPGRSTHPQGCSNRTSDEGSELASDGSTREFVGERTIDIIGVPMDLGADRRGVDMGPSAIRYAGLADRLRALGHTCIDGGDLEVPRPERHDPDAVDPTAKYLTEIEGVCRTLSDRTAETVDAGHLPLVLGGDHSIAIGTANGLGAAATSVLWFDAHADFNTSKTTPSGNVHGMSLAAMLGEGPFAEEEWARAPVEPENVAIVGLRDLDKGERDTLQESAVNTYTMTDIDERGIAAVVAEAIERVTTDVDALHVSFDMDVLDPSEAPGVGTPVRGGMTYREAHAALELVHADGPQIEALEIVEVNPILDRHNQTAELACELAASALGERIL